ncbi:DUF4878 domain-containing protein [Chitinophaga qingshengii]|uniref:DUF4878 domain-containing protein n=1 Tax=Chitinophaga qingshengii TaxID=1569794 RepID=A0ABR7TKT5_9BACT|nr:DUF4878 domain-containing protein [Chitinophaga qingshengii]MBC9929664.1 DUF4878 domain-containing protein [Chitinophaga qingshengii]
MTNYRRILTLAVMGMMLLSSCKKRATPQEVALSFMHAIQDSNFDQARDYATKESQQVIQIYSIFDGRRSDAEREKIRKAKIEVVGVEENGSTASVTIQNSSANQKEILQLVQEGGQWKISLTFESIIPNYIPPASQGLDSTSILPSDTTAGGVAVPAVK